MPTYRLDIAYDGTDFHGYARQPDVRTVQQVLEEALTTTTDVDGTQVAGRTDAGVHATGQVVSFHAGKKLDEEALVRTLNSLLPSDVAALRCQEMPDDFHARFSARARSYRYTVLNRPQPDPMLRRIAWHVSERLDVETMNRAAAYFLGEHDFASLCRRADGASTSREVTDAAWHQEVDLLRFEVTASSFCHQMVRSMVALCVEVGRGRIEATLVPQILEAKDRNAARGAAPPHGLELVSVHY